MTAPELGYEVVAQAHGDWARVGGARRFGSAELPHSRCRSSLSSWAVFATASRRPRRSNTEHKLLVRRATEKIVSYTAQRKIRTQPRAIDREWNPVRNAIVNIHLSSSREGEP
jgi:hypothetical protein